MGSGVMLWFYGMAQFGGCSFDLGGKYNIRTSSERA